MKDQSPALYPDEHDAQPLEAMQSSPSPLFVVEGLAFAAALLGAGLLMQALFG